jgi:hypothetical protein
MLTADRHSKPLFPDKQERMEYALKKVARLSITALSIMCRIEAMGRAVAPGLVLMPECLARSRRGLIGPAIFLC